MPAIKVGVIGYGNAARVLHVPYILHNPDLELYAFLQRSDRPSIRGVLGSSCEEDFPRAKRYRTADEFFADPDIELVVITTLHDTHAEFARRGIQAGKHVIVEKPFTATVADAEEILTLHSKSDKILTVFQNRQYDSDFLTLRRVIQSGALGDIHECEIHYDRDDPPPKPSEEYKPGDGVMFGLGSHTLDQALVLFGKPATVTGFYRPFNPNGTVTDRGFTIILQYGGDQSELLVTVKSNLRTKMNPPLKYFVRGTEGTFVKYGEDVQHSQFKSGVPIAAAEFGHEPAEYHGTLTTSKRVSDAQKQVGNSWEGPYVSAKGDWPKFWSDAVNAIRGGELVVKPEQSTDGLKVIELGRKSAEKGMTLPFE